MTIAAILFGLLLILICAPETALARWLFRWLVEKPAVSLSRVSSHQVLVTAMLLIVVGVLIWLEAGDMLRLLGLATPEIAFWATTFEITTYADLLAAGFIAWSVRTQISMRIWIGAKLPRLRRGPHHRARRTRRAARPDGKAANDDEGRGGWLAVA